MPRDRKIKKSLAAFNQLAALLIYKLERHARTAVGTYIVFSHVVKLLAATNATNIDHTVFIFHFLATSCHFTNRSHRYRVSATTRNLFSVPTYYYF